jgi:hypothetical protein
MRKKIMCETFFSIPKWGKNQIIRKCNSTFFLSFHYGEGLSLDCGDFSKSILLFFFWILRGNFQGFCWGISGKIYHSIHQYLIPNPTPSSKCSNEITRKGLTISFKYTFHLWTSTRTDKINFPTILFTI